MARLSLLRLIASGLLLLSAACAGGAPPPVRLDSQGGEAWTFDKPIAGTVSEGACDAVAIRSPMGTIVTRPDGGRFMARVPLRPGDNLVEAACRKAGAVRGAAAQQHWSVRIADTPAAWPRIVVTDAGITLNAGASRAAPAAPAPIVAHEWRAHPGNPAPLAGLPATAGEVVLPTPAANGEYRVILAVTDGKGRRDEGTAVFRVRGGKAEAVDLAREHPAWVDRAVIYGVAPHFFGKGRFADVAARLDDIAALGATVLWLSPLTATPAHDFGYAVTDHFRLRPTFGSGAELRALIRAAQARGLRVILDFVPNHLSSEHRYFTDLKDRGRASAYFDFFARGEAAHYFDWHELKNLNFDNPEVQRYVIEAFVHWLREYGVDGFRVDVAWGPRQRAPEFWPRWREALKRVDPDLLLLAEASARDPYYFRNGFDAAYDWTATPGEWAWRRAFDDEQRTARLLRAEIAASIAEGDSGALVLRYLNNNDTGARFITRYGLARTRVAAAMLLTLPGLPALYMGDEIGAAFEPYDEGPPIVWDDAHRLRPWYARLLALRRALAALRSPSIRLLDIAPADQLLAYLRPGATVADDVLVLLNYGAASIRIALPAALRESMAGSGRLLDVLHGERIDVDPRRPTVSLPGYGVRILKAG